MKSYLLCGSFGFGNVGDEAIVEALSDLHYEIGSTCALTMLTRFASPQRQFYGLPLSVQDDRDELEASLSRVPIVVAGGGVFEPKANAVAFKCFSEIVSANRNSSFLACSFEPGNYSFFQRRKARILMRNAKSFSVRDQWSAKLAHKLGGANVQCVGDLVLSLKPCSKLQEKFNSTERFVVVSLCPRWASDEWYSWIARELKDVSKMLDAKIVFLPMASINDGDVIVAQSVADKLEKQFKFENIELIAAQLSPRETLSLISKASLVVGMRLHSCVMACAAEVPFVPIAYHPKLMAFSETIGFESVAFPSFRYEEQRSLDEWKFDSRCFEQGLLCKLASRSMSLKVDLQYFRELQREKLRELVNKISDS